MSVLVERPRRATDRQLRQFAWALAAAAAVALALRAWRHAPIGAPALIAAAAAAAIALAGIVTPRRIAWLFSLTMTITLPIGVVLSELMLVVLYFGVITPMAVLARMTGRDRLHKTIDRSAQTYWIARRGTVDAARYFRES